VAEMDWSRSQPPVAPDSSVGAILPLTDAPVSARRMSELRRHLRSVVYAAGPSGTAAPDDVVADAVERLELVIEELSSNGRRHGRTPVQVAVHAADSGWLVSVTDAAPDRPPVLAVDRDPGQGGMGLRMVARLAVAHGWVSEGPRKTVWAVVAAG
jgi:anti-sigma regulatory factor (Ser/Thr protein kinase)